MKVIPDWPDFFLGAFVGCLCLLFVLFGAAACTEAHGQESVSSFLPECPQEGEVSPKKGESSQIFASAQVNVILICGHAPGEEMYVTYARPGLGGVDVEFVYRVEGGPCR